MTDDLERPRLVVLFRPLLAVPHAVWLVLWSLAAAFVALAAWCTALATARMPPRMHRFLAAYVRYATHVLAFACVVGRRFPGFAGRKDSYPIDVVLDPPGPRSRGTTLLRLVLAAPALIVVGVLAIGLLLLAFVGWWYALVMGRVPRRAHDLGAALLRYGARIWAYLFLLTDRFPR